MSGGPLLDGLTTGLFGLLGIWYAIRVAVPSSSTERTSAGLHLAMCGAMAAMPFALVPASPQILLFSGGALFFVWTALSQRGPDPDPALYGAHAGRIGASYHAGMMASMVWMAVAQTPTRPNAASTMPGMDMSGMTTPGGTGSDGGAVAMTDMVAGAGWAGLVSLGIGLAYGFVVIWLLEVVIRQAARSPIRPLLLADSIASALMAVGMCTSFLFVMT